MSEQKRRRRTREEARHELIEAAAARLLSDGPDALRIQQIAADAGVSHPTLLHHFGSREGLIQAAATRLMERSATRTLEAMEELAKTTDVGDVVSRSIEAFTDPSRTRALAWLALTGRLEEAERPSMTPYLEAVYALRDPQRGAVTASEDEMRFLLLVCAFSVFGMDLLGDVFFADAGLEDPVEARRQFRAFLVRMVMDAFDARD